jgi:hypothetical protein
MNFASRLLNIFVAPQATFEAEKQKSMWYVPLILFLILTTIGAMWLKPVTMQIQQEKMVESMEKRGMTSEQIDQAQERVQKMSGVWMMVPQLLTQAVFVLIVAAVWLFVSNILIGGSGKFPQMISVTAYSWLVVAVGMLIKAPIILSKTPFSISSMNVHFSPAIFLSNNESFFYKVLAQFDLFNVWCFFIVTIGIAVMTGRKTKQVWPMTAVIFLLYFVGAATMQSAFGF